MTQQNELDHFIARVKAERRNSLYPNHTFFDALEYASSIFFEIYEACGGEFQIGCGSYLFNGKEYMYDGSMLDKQLLFFQECHYSITSSLLEIGSYMGHSLLLALCANPRLSITCIDISNDYTGPATRVLQQRFPLATIDFIHSDSVTALSILGERSFDLVHIDGAHDCQQIAKETNLVLTKFCHAKDKRIIFDDCHTCMPVVQQLLTSHLCVRYWRANCSWSNAFIHLADQRS